MKKKAALITAIITLAALTGCSTPDENTALNSEIDGFPTTSVSETEITQGTESESESVTETTPAETVAGSVSVTAVSENKTEETKAEEKKETKANNNNANNNSNSNKQDFSAIVGTWYEKDSYYPRIISVNSDGIFKGYSEGATGNMAEGTVFRETVNGKDWYSLIDADRGLWYKFEVVTVDGVKEIVSEDNDMEDSYYFSSIKQPPKASPNPGAVPNEYGFCKVTDPPATSISVASLAGTWQNTDYPDEKMVITATDDLYYGKFTYYYDNGTEMSGYICYEFPCDIPFSAETDCFTFYNDAGSLFSTFSATGEIPLNDLYPYKENSGEHHMVRVE